MIIIRIDDYNTQSHEIVSRLIKETFSVLLEIRVIIWVIFSESDNSHLMELINNFWDKIILAFHWYIHSNTEFLQDIDKQEHSFKMVEKIFLELNYNKRFFIPPFNIFDDSTLKLLKKYNYKDFSINYKDYWSNKLFIGEFFSIWETNYFFNKKHKNLEWSIDGKNKIKSEINNLKFLWINIWVEIHPQHIKSKLDYNKYIYLLNCLEWKNYQKNIMKL